MHFQILLGLPAVIGPPNGLPSCQKIFWNNEILKKIYSSPLIQFPSWHSQLELEGFTHLRVGKQSVWLAASGCQTLFCEQKPAPTLPAKGRSAERKNGTRLQRQTAYQILLCNTKKRDFLSRSRPQCAFRPVCPCEPLCSPMTGGAASLPLPAVRPGFGPLFAALWKMTLERLGPLSRDRKYSREKRNAHPSAATPSRRSRRRSPPTSRTSIKSSRSRTSRKPRCGTAWASGCGPSSSHRWSAGPSSTT